MLANGITLAYKELGNYVILKGLKEIPEFGSEPEKVDATTLEDTVKQYEFGIGDYGDLEYTFKYENNAESSYRKLRGFAEEKNAC